MMLLALIAVGGAAGALVHYSVTVSVTDPRRVLVLTVCSCAVLGFVVAASPPQWLVGLACFGLLSSLAPFTSVALLTVVQVRERRYRAATLFLVSAVVGAIAAAMFGFLLYSSGLTLYRKF